MVRLAPAGDRSAGSAGVAGLAALDFRPLSARPAVKGLLVLDPFDAEPAAPTPAARDVLVLNEAAPGSSVPVLDAEAEGTSVRTRAEVGLEVCMGAAARI